MRAEQEKSRAAHQDALLALCADIFRDPRRIVEAVRVDVSRGCQQPEHRHGDLLQFDLALGCSGAWRLMGRALPPRGVTALVFYPGVAHGYALSGAAGATLLSFKLRLRQSSAALRHRIFPERILGLAGEQPLVRTLARLARLCALPQLRPAMAASAAAETLCLWPNLGEAHTQVDYKGDGRLEPVLEHIDEHLMRPPALGQLAHLAHVSPRHLARLFRATHGCTPHAYITARRAARARELLAQGGLRITEVAEALGFPEIHTFSRWFRREAGVSPAAFQRQPPLL